MSISGRTGQPRFLRVNEFAEQLRVSRATVYRWIDSGELESVRIAGVRRIPASEFDKLVGVSGHERGPDPKKRDEASKERMATAAKIASLRQRLELLQAEMSALAQEMQSLEGSLISG